MQRGSFIRKGFLPGVILQTALTTHRGEKKKNYLDLPGYISWTKEMSALRKGGRKFCIGRVKIGDESGFPGGCLSLGGNGSVVSYRVASIQDNLRKENK